MNNPVRTVAASMFIGCLLTASTFPASAQQNAAKAARALFEAGNIKAAQDAVLACADAHDAECQFLLARKIEEGKHYVRDLATAKKLYELSYQGGYDGAGPHVLRLTREILRGEDQSASAQPSTPPPARVSGEGPKASLMGPATPAAPVTAAPAQVTAYPPHSAGKKIPPPPRRVLTTTARDLTTGNGPPSPEAMANASSYELCVFRAMLQELPREAEVVVARRQAARELNSRGETCEPTRRYQTAAAAELRALGGQNAPSKGMRALSIVADIVGAVGRGMSAGSRRVNGDISSFGTKNCTSDYSCSAGQQCVKAPYQTSGQCMTPVDEYGIRTFDGPRSNSLGPEMTPQCQTALDCPIGFQCDATLKACIKR